MCFRDLGNERTREMKDYCDMHTHSTESDGTFTPKELVLAAKELDLAYLALTDHDTIAGIPEAIEAAEKAGVQLITGIEVIIDCTELPISLVDDSSLHMLGYLSHKNIFKMAVFQERLYEIRNERNIKMFEKAEKIGLPITIDDLKKSSSGKVITRGHFLRALIEKGYAKDKEDAFLKFLMPGGLIYVRKEKLSPQEVLKVITDNGGVAVLAHPLLIGLSNDELEALVIRLKTLGVTGIEAVYVENKPGQTEQIIELAARHQMFVTGGSDFHGDIKPGIYLGTGYGNLRVPKILAENVLKRIN